MQPKWSHPFGTRALTASAQDIPGYAFTFTLSQGILPTLYYKNVSVIAQLGSGVTNPTATINGVAPISSSYDSETGQFVFTTNQPGGTAIIRFNAAVRPTNVTVQKAALRDNKRWAWSHGMDDNTYLQKQIALLEAKGWRGTIFQIGQYVSPTRREEDWITDQPEMIRLLNLGWNMGDHTWSHACYGGTTASEISQGFAVAQQAVAASNVPDHTVISFAAPCFDSAYEAPFLSLRNGPTTLLLNETGGTPMMNVDGVTYTNGSITAAGVSGSTTQIGRDTSIESDTTATAQFDWMHTQSSSTRHFLVQYTDAWEPGSQPERGH